MSLDQSHSDIDGEKRYWFDRYFGFGRVVLEKEASKMVYKCLVQLTDDDVVDEYEDKWKNIF